MNERTVVVRRIEEGIALDRTMLLCLRTMERTLIFSVRTYRRSEAWYLKLWISWKKRRDFAEKIEESRQVVIKPNLVSVYHRSGMFEEDYPESTDPRVMDAVVEWVQKYNKKVLIAESSGKPMPTATSFRISGMDRIAGYREHRAGHSGNLSCPQISAAKGKGNERSPDPYPLCGRCGGKRFLYFCAKTEDKSLYQSDSGL